ncbi:MAG: copper chaperone PCu(A)C [Oricola sp.]
MSLIRTLFVAVSALLFLAAGVSAHEYKLGALELVHPVARATPPGAPVSGGYLVIRNTGAEADRLIGGSTGFAGKVEIHEMVMDGDVMKMRPVDGGLEIPAGGEVTLKPGGYHVMFMMLKEPLQADSKQKVTLQFEKAGSIEVEFLVQTPEQLQMPMHMTTN